MGYQHGLGRFEIQHIVQKIMQDFAVGTLSFMAVLLAPLIILQLPSETGEVYMIPPVSLETRHGRAFAWHHQSLTARGSLDRRWRTP